MDDAGVGYIRDGPDDGPAGGPQGGPAMGGVRWRMGSAGRGRVLLLSSGGNVALIRRRRRGRVYWSLPGGGRHRGETPREAARREVAEELGLDVEPQQLVATAAGHAIYLARVPDEPPLRMQGPEVERKGGREDYRPAWVPPDQLNRLDVRPRSVRKKLSRLAAEVAQTEGAQTDLDRRDGATAADLRAAGPRWPGGRHWPVHVFTGCALGVLICAGLAALTGQPWLLPSLGPTAMLQLEQPGSDPASPRNTLVGHAVALVAGYLALLVFGLAAAPSALTTGVDLPRIGAATASLAVTAAVLFLIRRPHPPAGASALIVSLGLLRTPQALAVALASVVVLTLSLWIYSRLTGHRMPLWAPDDPSRSPAPVRAQPGGEQTS